MHRIFRKRTEHFTTNDEEVEIEKLLKIIPRKLPGVTAKRAVAKHGMNGKAAREVTTVLKEAMKQTKKKIEVPERFTNTSTDANKELQAALKEFQVMKIYVDDEIDKKKERFTDITLSSKRTCKKGAFKPLNREFTEAVGQTFIETAFSTKSNMSNKELLVGSVNIMHKKFPGIPGYNVCIIESWLKNLNDDEYLNKESLVKKFNSFLKKLLVDGKFDQEMVNSSNSGQCFSSQGCDSVKCSLLDRNPNHPCNSDKSDVDMLGVIVKEGFTIQ